MGKEELLKELKEELLNYEFSMIELSNIMLGFGFNDIFNLGDVDEFVDSGSIIFTSSLLDKWDEYIQYEVFVERVDDGDIKVTGIEIF